MTEVFYFLTLLELDLFFILNSIFNLKSSSEKSANRVFVSMFSCVLVVSEGVLFYSCA